MQMHMDVVAKNKAGNIEGWEPWYYESIGGGVLIKGGIPRLITKGPRKGQKTWDTKSSQTVFVNREDVAHEYRRYEAETGKCGECMGEGKVLASAGVSGTTYRTCRVCGGTGKAPAHTPSATTLPM